MSRVLLEQVMQICIDWPFFPYLLFISQLSVDVSSWHAIIASFFICPTLSSIFLLGHRRFEVCVTYDLHPYESSISLSIITSSKMFPCGIFVCLVAEFLKTSRQILMKSLPRILTQLRSAKIFILTYLRIF